MILNKNDVPTPNIAVLLAAYNGINFIKDQLLSILSQLEVNITVYISVDKSIDGTEDYLLKWSQTEPRLKLMPLGNTFGSAGSNFYRLIKEVDFLSFDYVAYSDQDDIWNPNKIACQIKLLRSKKADAVSSDVIAFGVGLNEKVVKKSYPQKSFDFIFESAGPGCSFLMKPILVNRIYEQLISHDSLANAVVMHDWLTYAICRAHNMKWIIDSVPTLKYRQHHNNVIGANIGFKSLFARYIKIKNGWYRDEVAKICQVCFDINGDDRLRKLGNILNSKNLLSNFLLLPYVFKGRRKFTDILFLAAMVSLFVF